MSNDFPDAVFSQQEAALAYSRRQPVGGNGTPRVYWHLHELPLDKEIPAEEGHPPTCECPDCWQAMESGGPRW